MKKYLVTFKTDVIYVVDAIEEIVALKKANVLLKQDLDNGRVAGDITEVDGKEETKTSFSRLPSSRGRE